MYRIQAEVRHNTAANHDNLELDCPAVSGGYGHVVFHIRNVGTVDAWLCKGAVATSGIRVPAGGAAVGGFEAGPFVIPGGAPYLYTPLGADCYVTPLTTVGA